MADKVTTAALSAATGSGSAHALGNQRDTNDCEDGYQELPSVSQRPVVQRSQERLGFGRPGQMADENDALDRRHCDDECDCGVICTPNEAPEATMIASTKTTPSRLGPIAAPITKATHTEPFSHALRTP